MERSDKVSITLDGQMANSLLIAMNDCTEWGQVQILDLIAFVVPDDESNAILIAEKVAPRLQHSNSAIVLGSIRNENHNEDNFKAKTCYTCIYLFVLYPNLSS